MARDEIRSGLKTWFSPLSQTPMWNCRLGRWVSSESDKSGRHSHQIGLAQLVQARADLSRPIFRMRFWRHFRG